MPPFVQGNFGVIKRVAIVSSFDDYTREIVRVVTLEGDYIGGKPFLGFSGRYVRVAIVSSDDSSRVNCI